MLESFKKFQRELIQNEISYVNERFDKIIKSYSFINITESIDFNENQNIYENYKNSNLIVVKYCLSSKKSVDKPYFIIIFKKTILIIESSYISFIQSFLTSNDQLKIYFLPGSKDIFNSKIEIQYQEFLDYIDIDIEVSSLNEQLKLKRNKSNLFWTQSRKSLCCYLIKESYLKSEEDRFEKYVINKKTIQPKIFEEDEFIKLKIIEIGSTFYAFLIYHIEFDELMILKVAKDETSKETSKLFEREKSNYLKIDHLYISKYYGEVKNKKEIIIEFINGETLLNIKNLEFNEKIIILFELAVAIYFLHSNNFIYRDLKPNNVMIDKNKNAVLIDFDQMVLKEDVDKNENNTLDFSSSFVAPEIFTNHFSFECDVYSFGKIMIHTLSVNIGKIDSFIEYGKYMFIYKLFEMCMNENPNNRPNIYYIFVFFLFYYEDHISPIIEKFMKISNVNSDEKDRILRDIIKSKFTWNENLLRSFYYAGPKYPYEFYTIGQYFEKGEFGDQNINVALFFYTKGAELMDPYSLDYLGKLYYKGIYVQQDINKAIHYLTLASKQDHVVSFYNLGIVYFNFPDKPIDMEKAIYYFTIAGDKNMKEAQNILGMIYLSNSYNIQNFDKSIYYYTLAANQNCSISQQQLGQIYLYYKHDVNKALEYLEQSANQNNIDAIMDLGFIYYNGKYVTKNIEKSKYYFTLASNQNNHIGQYYLGIIYASNDEEKSLYYLTLSANNNNSEAQVILGNYYFYKNRNKALNYLELAANQNNAKAQYILGRYNITNDFNKSIQYLTNSANQNYIDSLYFLGRLYFDGYLVPINIQKAIYYFNRAAKLNDGMSQYELAGIYMVGMHVPRDSDKGVHFLKLAANNNIIKAVFNLGLFYENEGNVNEAIKYYLMASEKNYHLAQLNLGCIYYDGKHVKQDISKSIYYFTLAADFVPDAQFNLGLIYEKYFTNKIDQSIYFYTLAAKNNIAKAQYKLGYFYYEGKHVKQNIEKSLKLLTLSSNNNFDPAHFMIGYLYHEGKYVKQDIFKSIEYYKKGTLLNYQYSLNNLGVIYKNGFGNLIEKNLGYSIQYFTDAIKIKNDVLSLFNLAQIYLYEIPSDENLLKSIDLYIKSYRQYFNLSHDLMIIALIKKFGFDFEKYEQLLKNYAKNPKGVVEAIKIIIYSLNLFDVSVFNYYYESCKNIDFLYNYKKEIIQSRDFYNIKVNQTNEKKRKDMTKDFYEGFGIE